MKRKELLKWFSEEVLPRLVQSGGFLEENEVLEKCDFEEIQKGTSSFASFPSFAKITVKTPSGYRFHEILVKFQCQDPLFREKMRTVAQYKNEVAMYSQVLPGFAEFLKKERKLLDDVVPRCHHAVHDAEDPEKSIVILGDLRTEGYRVSEAITDLDLRHCLVSVEKLARFHAVSFAMKFANWKPFEELKNSYVHVWYSNDDVTRQHARDFKLHCAQRGIDYLLSRDDPEVPREYLENFRKFLEPIFDLLLSLIAPKEPLSVICHGDFNRNNILYKYNSEGEVIDAKLIDFQTFLYGSPCLDLSFFLYMNTTLELRERHFDSILTHYHSVLVRTVAQILNEGEEVIRERIPLQALMEDFGRVAVTAYVTVAFFLPIMMTPPQEGFEEDIMNKTPREIAEENYLLGGETASKRIAQVIVDFYRRGFYTRPLSGEIL